MRLHEEINFEDIKDEKELGKWLKKIREQKGMTLEEINIETKIRIRYLDAIENGNFDIIPGGIVYIKGFLRNYAESIGLDPTPVIEKYKDINKLMSEEVKIQEQEKEQIEVRPRQEKQKLYSYVEIILDKLAKLDFKKLISIIAVILVLTIVFFISKQLNRPPTSNDKPKVTIPKDTDKKIPQNKQNTDDNNAQKSENNKEPDVKDVKIEKAQDTNNKTVYDVYDTSLNLTLEVLEDCCWMSVKRDDSVEFEGTVEAGEIKKWEASDNLTIKAGKPSAIRLTINGQEIEKISDGRVRTYVFKTK